MEMKPNYCIVSSFFSQLWQYPRRSKRADSTPRWDSYYLPTYTELLRMYYVLPIISSCLAIF